MNIYNLLSRPSIRQAGTRIGRNTLSEIGVKKKVWGNNKQIA